MRMAQWRTGQTVREMAAKWGVCVQRAEEISAMASKRVIAEMEAAGVNGTKVLVTHALEQVIADGIMSRDPKARANVINAGKTLALIAGAMAPVRIKHELEGYERMTEEEREAELKRLVAMVKI